MTRPAQQIFATSKNRTPNQRYRVFWGMLFIFYVIAGALWLHIFADRFVFYVGELYTKISLWSVVLFTPFVLYRMKRSSYFTDDLAKKYPTAWIRKCLVMPLTAAMLVGGFFAAPVGWLFAAAAWYGGPVQYLNATAVDVGTYARRKGCDQFATLRFATTDKETCLDNLYASGTIRQGQVLGVGAAMFPFGFLVLSVTAVQK